MNEYIKQANDFLESTGTTFKIEYLRTGPYFTDDNESRDIYAFTLSNTRGSYSAKFGSSMRATHDRATAAAYRACSAYGKDEAKIKAAITRHKANPTPSAYDILSGLEKYGVNPIFTEWADDLGYNDAPMSDYPKIVAIHQACLAEYAALRRMFTAEQMDALGEIS